MLSLLKVYQPRRMIRQFFYHSANTDTFKSKTNFTCCTEMGMTNKIVFLDKMLVSAVPEKQTTEQAETGFSNTMLACIPL